MHTQPQFQQPRSPMPVRSSADAVHLITLALGNPDEYETLAFFLDPQGRGGIISAVPHTLLPDSVIDVVEWLTCRLEPWSDARALVVASIRPDIGLLPGDADRWMEINTLCEQHGARLLEWYVLSRRGVECPRDLLGEPPRWPPR